MPIQLLSLIQSAIRAFTHPPVSPPLTQSRITVAKQSRAQMSLSPATSTSSSWGDNISNHSFTHVYLLFPFDCLQTNQCTNPFTPPPPPSVFHSSFPYLNWSIVNSSVFSNLCLYLITRCCMPKYLHTL